MNITFPDLRQAVMAVRVEFMIIALICGFAGGFVAKLSKTIGVALCLPLAFLFCSDIMRVLTNRWDEFRWSRIYARRISSRKLSDLISSQPARFVLHARFFRQICRTQLAPMGIIEDTKSGDLIAIYPSSWRAIEVCRKFGLKEEKY